MRILAIRGQNIASLADPFEVDLQREPLASASLYAIAGPTGAGKSSLLDALCVALYDQTPRTAAAPAHGGELPEPEDHAISARDSRQLLHRGAVEGYAEVDFVGVDQLAYRARWSVRRAHGKRGGRLQKTRLSLHRLPELTPLADVGNKSEALEAIRAKVGLDYRQFTRAVLLAQNEFAAFLRADQDERAQLLQTLTGSERFERLSIAAYQRARLEASQTELLQQQRQASTVLGDTERATLEQGWERAGSRRNELREQHEQIRQWQLWQQQQFKLDIAAAQAADVLAQASALHEQAAPRRRELDRQRLLRDLRQPWQRARDLAEQRRILHTELEHALHELGAVQARQRDEQQQVELAGRAAEQHRLRSDSLAPQLRQAEQLDEEISRQSDSLQQQAQSLAQLQQELDQQGRKLASDECRQSVIRTAQERLRAELEARSAEAWLLQPDQSWRLELTQLQRLRADVETANGEQQQAQAVVTVLQHEHELAQLEQQSLEREQASALAAQADGEARLHEERFERLPVQLADAHRRSQAHTVRAFKLRRRLGLEMEHQRRADRSAAVRQLLTTIERRLPEVQSAVGAAEAARIQADAALFAAQQAAGISAVELRSALQSGHPCPVCGSRDHPYADPLRLLADHGQGDAAATEQLPRASSPLQQLLEVLRQQRARAQAAEQAQRDERSGMHAQADAGRNELQRLAQDDNDAKPQREQLLDDLRADPAALALLELSAADLETELQSDEAALEAESAALNELERQRAEAEQALRSSNASCKAIAAHLHELEQRVSSVERSIIDARQRLALATTEQRLQQQRLEQLGASVEKWLQPLGSGAGEPDLASLQLRLDQRAAARRESEQNCATQDAELRELEQTLPRLRGHLEARQATARESCERLDALRQALQKHREERLRLLDGESVVSVRAAIEQASRDTEAALTDAVASAQRASIDLAQARTLVARIEQQREQTGSALIELRQELQLLWRDIQDKYASLAGIEPELAARVFDQPELEPTLDHEGDTPLRAARADLEAALTTAQSVLDQEQAALASIDEALRSASQAYSIRLQAIQSHATDQPLGARPVDIEQALAETTAELDEREQDFSSLTAQRVRDDQLRQQLTDLATAIEAQNLVSRRWNQLSELIGSADGKKFRNLAQRRSLHLLLRHGNLQLRQLGSRYSLRPLKDQLNFLLVDRDLGGELRSVHSLSGGESFLVSLALALALANLSSQQMAIESLFVDEGFGSLDEDTLNTAMQALDRLQAQGRKVGVISHLRELTERIGVQIEVRPQRAGRSRVVVRQQ